MPCVVVTGGDGLRDRVAGADGQMQCNSAVAALGISASVTRTTSRTSICGAVPSVAVASGNVFYGSCTMVDGEVECYCAVAAY